MKDGRVGLTAKPARDGSFIDEVELVVNISLFAIIILSVLPTETGVAFPPSPLQ